MYEVKGKNEDIISTGMDNLVDMADRIKVVESQNVSTRCTIQCVRKDNSMFNTLPDILSRVKKDYIIQRVKEEAPMPGSLPGILEGTKRHHIIPDSVLQRFWNKVLENAHNTADMKLYEQLKNLAFNVHKKRFKNDSKIIKDEIDQIDRAKTYGQYYNSQNEIDKAMRSDLSEKTINDIDDDDLKSMFVWMPSNIVIGTGNRLMEPKDTLDREAMVIAGKDRGITQELYVLILEYINEDGFERYDELSRLLNEYMNSPYINMGDGKFLKKEIKKIPEKKFRPWMFDIGKGVHGEKRLLEDAIQSMKNMPDDKKTQEWLQGKIEEYEERLKNL